MFSLHRTVHSGTHFDANLPKRSLRPSSSCSPRARTCSGLNMFTAREMSTHDTKTTEVSLNGVDGPWQAPAVDPGCASKCDGPAKLVVVQEVQVYFISVHKDIDSRYMLYDKTKAAHGRPEPVIRLNIARVLSRQTAKRRRIDLQYFRCKAKRKYT